MHLEKTVKFEIFPELPGKKLEKLSRYKKGSKSGSLKKTRRSYKEKGFYTDNLGKKSMGEKWRNQAKMEIKLCDYYRNGKTGT